MQYTLGIDLHKRTSAWVLIDGEHKEVWHKNNVPCHPHHISATIKEIPVPVHGLPLAIEPTCGWRWVSDIFSNVGMDVHFANPLKVKLISESKQKHDRGDARTLAQLLQSGFLPEAFKVSDELYALRTLLRTRAFFVRHSTAMKNYLQGMATTRGLHEYPGMSPLKKSSKEYIRESADFEAKQLLTRIGEQERLIKEFDAPMREWLKSQPQARLLMTIPGVGMLTALVVISEIGDVSRFCEPGKLAAFAGLVPSQHSSGEHVRYGHITNQGSRMLRTAITEAAMRITPTNAPALYGYYERLVEEKKKTLKQARVALARKLVSIIWAMLKNDEEFKMS